MNLIVDALEARRKQWSAPMDQAIQTNFQRINCGRYSWAEFECELKQLQARQDSQTTVHQEIESFYDLLCAMYLEASSDERAQIRALFENRRGLQSALLGYVYRAAKQINTREDHAWLRLGLAAISIEDFAVDYRDTLLALSELYFAAEKAGITPQPFLNQAAELSSDIGHAERVPPACQVLLEFSSYAVLAERRRRN